MQVEIWSDVQCPFCYIGKRKFEAALDQFVDRDAISVVWKSFQLDPEQPTLPDKTIYEYLAERKGLTLQQARQMTSHATAMAQQAGLTFNFDKSITANSFDAHRLIHLAKAHGLQNEAEERLFAAYFTEGLNIADLETLVTLGESIGLSGTEIRTVLASNQFANAVQHDIREAQMFGVRGVPFFVFDRKYAISGAQGSPVFLDALNTSFNEWKQANPTPVLTVTEGDSCSIDGTCD